MSLHCLQYGMFQKEVGKSRNRELSELFQSGLGIHHAGMLRADRTLSERLFEAGVIKWGCPVPPRLTRGSPPLSSPLMRCCGSILRCSPSCSRPLHPPLSTRSCATSLSSDPPCSVPPTLPLGRPPSIRALSAAGILLCFLPASSPPPSAQFPSSTGSLPGLMCQALQGPLLHSHVGLGRQPSDSHGHHQRNAAVRLTEGNLHGPRDA